MAQPATQDQLSKRKRSSTNFTALDSLAILMVWLFFLLMLFAVLTAVRNGL